VNTNERLKGFQYNGIFALEFLTETEAVRIGLVTDPGSCEIGTDGSFINSHYVSKGNVVTRLPDGTIAVIELVPEWSDSPDNEI
jgi:hypothetical protein